MAPIERRRGAEPPSSRKARRAVRTGRWAESIAAWLLRAKGYRIVARSWRCPAGEIDIIARRGPHLVAVEVKRRASAIDVLHALQARQRRRIVRAAEAYVARNPESAALNIRFDAVLVAPGRWPRHIKDAWRP
jgi:putative endonuclease